MISTKVKARLVPMTGDSSARSTAEWRFAPFTLSLRADG